MMFSRKQQVIVFKKSVGAKRKHKAERPRAKGIDQTNGLLRELNPGPLAPEARIMPLDQAANET